MNHLTSLLERLRQAECAYKVADGSIDSSPLQVIVCREELSQSRFAFDKLSAKLVKELLSNDEWLKEAARFINTEEY